MNVFILQIRMDESLTIFFESCSVYFRYHLTLFLGETLTSTLQLAESLVATLQTSRGLLLNLRICTVQYVDVMERDKLVQCMYWLLLGWLCGFSRKYQKIMQVRDIREHVSVYHAVRFTSDDLLDLITQHY